MLLVNVHSRTMTLSVRLRGQQTQTYVLKDVEQGHSPGSGTGGHADTIIRGKNADNIFTLFGGYENDSTAYYQHTNPSQASLEITGSKSALIVCHGAADRYMAPWVKGLGGGYGTNAYLLSDSGVVKEMTVFPDDSDSP